MQSLLILVNVSCFTQTRDGGVTTWMFRPYPQRSRGPGDRVRRRAARGAHLARHGRIEFGTEIEIRQGVSSGPRCRTPAPTGGEHGRACPRRRPCGGRRTRGVPSGLKRGRTRMAISVHGVVARGKGEVVEVTEVLVPEPGPVEALCGSASAVSATPICTTRWKGSATTSLGLLGHEAAGIVEQVGDNDEVVRRLRDPQLAGGLRDSAARASAASRGTASPRTTRRRR